MKHVNYAAAIEKTDLSDIALPVVHAWGKSVGLDLRGKPNKKQNLEAILERVAKGNIPDLPRELIMFATRLGVISHVKKPAPAVAKANGDAPPEETVSKPKAVKPIILAKKEHRELQPKAGEASVLAISRDEVDKALNTILAIAETESTGVVDARLAQGKIYRNLQEAASKRGFPFGVGGKMVTLDKYAMFKGVFNTLARTQVRSYCRLSAQLAGEDGEIHENIKTAARAVGPARLEVLSGFPDPKEALLKGIVIEGKRVPVKTVSTMVLKAHRKELLAAQGKDTTKLGPRITWDKLPRYFAKALAQQNKYKILKVPEEIKPEIHKQLVLLHDKLQIYVEMLATVIKR